MVLNELPGGYTGPQKRRTEFASPNEKLEFDGENLVDIAEEISQRTGQKVRGLGLLRRQDDDVGALTDRIIPVELRRGL